MGPLDTAPSAPWPGAATLDENLSAAHRSPPHQPPREPSRCHAARLGGRHAHPPDPRHPLRRTGTADVPIPVAEHPLSTRFCGLPPMRITGTRGSPFLSCAQCEPVTVSGSCHATAAHGHQVRHGQRSGIRAGGLVCRAAEDGAPGFGDRRPKLSCGGRQRMLRFARSVRRVLSR